MTIGPDVLKLAGIWDAAQKMVDAGTRPNPAQLDLIVRAVLGDPGHAYWNPHDPSHDDAVEIVVDLRAFSLNAQGEFDVDRNSQEYLDKYVQE